MKQIVLIASLTVLTACGTYHQVEGTVDASKVSNSFASMEKVVFGPNCVGCHSQFANYAGVLRELNSITSEITSGHMPKAAPLDQNLQTALKLWIDKGT